MNTEQIIKLAREAGFTQKNGFSKLIVRHSNGAWVDIADDLMRFAALVAQAERESRQAAQVENEQLKARLAHSGVELRKAVRDEREACAKFCDSAGHHWSGAPAHALFCAAEAIRARNRIADTSKTIPGLALDSGEFVPAAKITDWAAA